MDYIININKICRVCLEESLQHTSIFNTEFSMMPAEMIMLCARIKVDKNDGLPPVICSNCIYRLGAAYHFKQQCESSDHRLRSYLGLLDRGYGTRDNETNTDETMHLTEKHTGDDVDEDEDGDDDDDGGGGGGGDGLKRKIKKSKSRNRYERKHPEELKKRGPKPQVNKLPQTCYDCNKTFKCAAQLHMHIRTHTGERPYKCSYCSRRFAQKHNLAIHERTHTGERPFQCEICSKQFAALGNFQAHKKIHSGVRDQICPVCNKGFITTGDLARHMITHTGLKNHHCDSCGKSFSRNRDMVAHKKKIHLNERSQKSEQFKCRECHKVFATQINLSMHYRIHGNILQQHNVPIQPTAIGGGGGGGGLIGHGVSNITSIGNNIGGMLTSTQSPLQIPSSSSSSLNVGNIGLSGHHHHHHHNPHHLMSSTLCGSPTTTQSSLLSVAAPPQSLSPPPLPPSLPPPSSLSLPHLQSQLCMLPGGGVNTHHTQSTLSPMMHTATTQRLHLF